MADARGRRQRHRPLPTLLKLIPTCLSLALLLPKSTAFVIPAISRPHCLFSLQESTPSNKASSSSKDEVEIYRNRAALTERILKEKMQEMKLLQNKVQILQNVVKKMQAPNVTLIEQEKLLTLKWQQEETKQREATRRQVTELQLELNRTRSQLDIQATRHLKTIQELTSQQKLDRQTWKEQEQAFRKEEQGLQNKIRALQKEVLDMDQTLEMTQGELMSVQKRLAARQDELQTLSNEYEIKRFALQEKLESSLQEKTELQSKLEEQTASEEERRESVEIASAAVRAAETREARIRQELAVLQGKLDQVENKYKQEVAQANSNNQQTIKDLIQELDEERKKNAQNRKRDRQEFEKKLEAQRETYEADLRLFRTNNTTQASQTEALKNQDEQPMQKATTVDSEASISQKSSNKGKRGLWRRLRSVLPRRKG